MTSTYSIDTECGHMVIPAATLDDAKHAYERAHHYDFDAAPTTPGSWYRITDDATGAELESTEAEAIEPHRECRQCGRSLPVAADQTDTPPSADEVVLDAAGETKHRNYYVCGQCWSEAQ